MALWFKEFLTEAQKDNSYPTTGQAFIMSCVAEQYFLDFVWYFRIETFDAGEKADTFFSFLKWTEKELFFEKDSDFWIQFSVVWVMVWWCDMKIIL